MLSSVGGFACAVFLIVTGIGLLQLKRWASVWTLRYGLFAIGWGILVMIVNIVFFQPAVMGFRPNRYQ